MNSHTRPLSLGPLSLGSRLALFAFVVLAWTGTASAQQGGEISEIAALRQEVRALRQAYESRIAELEQKLSKVEDAKPQSVKLEESAPVSAAPGGRLIRSNVFNPSIGVILNGRYSNFSNSNSNSDSEIAGFASGEEGERGREGLSLNETEFNAAANIDDKFSGSVTAAVVREEGRDNIELEEAYIQSQPGAGLPPGLNLKVGRALWSFGYLNELHAHTDDFADRPLPYRAFLNSAFNDDGVQVSYVLPTDFYSEVGGGWFRGDDYPFGEVAGSSTNAFSGFLRTGGDIGEDQNWRIGASVLGGDTDKRTTSEDAVTFAGDTNLYAADVRYTWAPTGNPREQELLLQGEYLWRNEDGTYEDTENNTGPVSVDGGSSGFYTQAVYKFRPQWRVGARFSQLDPMGVAEGLIGSALDAQGHSPKTYSGMLDWSNSEFSRIRFQFNREELSKGEHDNQFIVQYIMSIGAHGAHPY